MLNWGVSTKAVYDIASNMALTFIGGYRFVDTTFGFDVDGSPVALEQTRNNTGEEHWTGELRFTGTTKIVDWAVGAFYYRGPWPCAHDPGLALARPAALPEPSI